MRFGGGGGTLQMIGERGMLMRMKRAVDEAFEIRFGGGREPFGVEGFGGGMQTSDADSRSGGGGDSEVFAMLLGQSEIVERVNGREMTIIVVVVAVGGAGMRKRRG